MADYKNDINNITLSKAVETLRLRFPVTHIAKTTGLTKGNISNYLNNKKPVSDNFLRIFFEKYNLDITKYKTNYEDQIENKDEGEIINTKKLPEKEIMIIPIAGRGGLENSYYDDLVLSKLKIEKLSIKEPSSKGSKWFKIEVKGVSMDNGTKRSLSEGDWAYCRSISKLYWKDKFHTHRWSVFCFFHNERGIIFKQIKDQDVENGILTLSSLNEDKKKFPDFTIKLSECSIICNVIKVLSDF